MLSCSISGFPTASSSRIPRLRHALACALSLRSRFNPTPLLAVVPACLLRPRRRLQLGRDRSARDVFNCPLRIPLPTCSRAFGIYTSCVQLTALELEPSFSTMCCGSLPCSSFPTDFELLSCGRYAPCPCAVLCHTRLCLSTGEFVELSYTQCTRG